MAKIVLRVSMSLDGFIAGANDSADNPMGDGGDRLHDWMFKDEGEELAGKEASNLPGRGSFKSDITNADLIKDYFESSGAYLMGRRWFDSGEKPWGKEPPFQAPVFVVTHRERSELIKGKTNFIFVTDGLEAAVRAAKAAAGDKNVTTGGANIPQQLIQAGLLDEIYLSIVPILLGSGTPLFDRATKHQTELQRISVIEAPGVTHIHYRIVK